MEQDSAEKPLPQVSISGPLHDEHVGFASLAADMVHTRRLIAELREKYPLAKDWMTNDPNPTAGRCG